MTDAGLRQISTIAIAVLTATVLTVVTSLVLLSSKLHTASNLVGDSIASVMIAEESEVDLLVHARASESIVRGHLENRLERKLADGQTHVTSPAEQVALDRARQTVGEYLALAPSPRDDLTRVRTLGAAHRAIREWVDINLAEADAARRSVQRWDTIGTYVGVAAGVLMVAVLVALGWWIRRAVVRPMLDLAGAMEDFGTDARPMQVSERGASEIYGMATRFNALAARLARQHEQRLTYLAAVAHDLRNPLNVLRLSTDQIDPEGPLPPDERVRRVLSMVRRQVTRLERMVLDLLETTQIEAGRLSLRPERIDLREVVRAAVDLFEGTAPRHQLTVQLPDEPVVLRADATRIEQALTNLVSNAIKYSPDGGEVTITTQVDDAHAVVAVADRGVGISKQEQNHLWEPFRRGPSTGTIPGTGLGLSTSKRIIEAHGGEVVVESEPGVGSTFSLRLPLLR